MHVCLLLLLVSVQYFTFKHQFSVKLQRFFLSSTVPGLESEGASSLGLKIDVKI